MKFRIDVPIYKTGVHFLIGETDEVCREYVRKKTHGHWKEGVPLDEGARARVLLHESRLSFVRIQEEDLADIPVIAHELAHCAFFILREVGISPIIYENEESFCYLLEFLLTKFQEKVKKI